MNVVPPYSNQPHTCRNTALNVRAPTLCPVHVRFVVVELVRIAAWAQSHSPTVAEDHRRRCMQDAGLACRLAAELLHDAVLRPWGVIQSRTADDGAMDEHAESNS